MISISVEKMTSDGVILYIRIEVVAVFGHERQ